MLEHFNTNNNVFVKSKIKPPPELLSCHCHVLNIYESLIFMTAKTWSNAKIMFYDFISQKWFNSKAKCPVVTSWTKVIDGKDDFVYFGPALWINRYLKLIGEILYQRNYAKCIKTKDINI